MHKVMTGVTDDVNRANAQTGEEVFGSWKVIPRLDRWRDVLNYQFLPLFGSTGDGVEWDHHFPLPLNREQDNAELTAKANAAAVLVAPGIWDPDDILRVVGLPAMATITSPAPPVPSGSASPGPEGTPAGSQEDYAPAALMPFTLDHRQLAHANGNSHVQRGP